MNNILDGRKVAAEILDEIKEQIQFISDKGSSSPTLATILVGDDPASAVYVRKKVEKCRELGITSVHCHLPGDCSAGDIQEKLLEFNSRYDIHGILLQLPLPTGLPENELLDLIEPHKDVDGFHPENVGRLILGRTGFVSCTPAGIMELLRRYRIPISGRRAVVVGRSNIVGKPMSYLLLREHATVTICHSRTEDLPSVCREADILIAAVGKAGMITGEYVKESAVVVDVGMNRVTEGEEVLRISGEESSQWRIFNRKGSALVGDVEWRTVAPKSGWITPVPGGVGPLTIAMLMKNTLQAYQNHQNQ